MSYLFVWNALGENHLKRFLNFILGLGYVFKRICVENG